MAIKSIKILNVMAFGQRLRNDNEEHKEFAAKMDDVLAFSLKFCDGINILIGENGVGKTTILKMIYAATQWSISKNDSGKTQKFIQFFSSNLSDVDLLKNKSEEGYSYFEVSDGTHKFTNSLSHKRILNYDDWFGLNIPSVFIPTMEMLSHSNGFLALNQKYKLPFDGTQVDIIINASLPETRELPDYMDAILAKISDAIDGTILMENDTFYVLKKDGRKIDFSLEAEGLRKLGLLWKLIRNGLLDKGTILLWDEPEANLNPELFPLVVDILLELEKAGIQIFIATHSYNLAKYFEIRRANEEQVQYHNLYNATAEVTKECCLPEGTHSEKNSIFGESGNYLSELKCNRIVEADNKLLDEALKKNLGD